MLDPGATPGRSTNLPIVRAASASRMRLSGKPHRPTNRPSRLHCGCRTRRKGWGSPQGEPAALLQTWSLAQLVEQQSPKLPVGGSSPSRSATLCGREGGFLREPHKLFNHGSSPCPATLARLPCVERVFGCVTDSVAHPALPRNGMTRAGSGRWLCRYLIPASAQLPRQLGDGLRLHAGSRPECGYTVSPATFCSCSSMDRASAF